MGTQGYTDTTGTEVQPRGFMSAAAGEMTLNVAQLNQIGGLLQATNPDGSTNNTATQQLVGGGMAQLGSSFTQTTEQNKLNTICTVAAGFGVGQLFGLVAAVVMAVVTYCAASAAIGATLGAESATFAAGTATATAGLGNIAVSAGIAGVASSAAGQPVSSGSVNWGSAFESGAIAAITAGLTNEHYV